jgi:hypothetical protein
MKEIEMKTFNVTSSGSALSMPHGTYVLASEAQDEINKANADWIERCSKFRKQDAEESDERIKVLEDEREVLKANAIADQGILALRKAELSNLRASHATLVEKSRLYLKYSDTTVAPLETKELKAALADVK